MVDGLDAVPLALGAALASTKKKGAQRTQMLKSLLWPRLKWSVCTVSESELS